jgi:hypothetical protein
LGDRVERSSAIGAQLDPLNHRGPVAEPVHLLPGQRDLNRALERACRQHGQHDLKLRAQPGAEPAAHER